jgi:hypothetical protein
MPIDPTWSLEVRQKLPPTYEAAVAEFERDLIRQVNQEMHGQDVLVVQAVLTERLRGRLPGVEADAVSVHRIARAISDGTLTDWLAHPRQGLVDHG